MLSIGSLYIGSLKALINDHFRRLEQLCDELRIPVHRWHGDISSSQKKRLLKEPRGILLITPESLESIFVNHGHYISHLFGSIGSIVIDELHAFIGSERGRQLQSLLHRLESNIQRRIRLIGLSATLSDMISAAQFISQNNWNDVVQLTSRDGGQEVKLQIRGYISKRLPSTNNQINDELESIDDTNESITTHIFKTHRGVHNLIFCNSRQDVESYTDKLTRMSEADKLPNEFFPHHGSMARELRLDIEERLKQGHLPVNVVCTSTLEMGIDIGCVAAIAQIGVPNNVSSLRQRLGRSGRKKGDPAVLRIYIEKQELSQQSSLQDMIHPQLIQAIAMTRLLIRRWYEPPEKGRLHLSTLVQQILLIIAQYGGTTAQQAWNCLCQEGPFKGIDQSQFTGLLRSLGKADVLMQANDGTILPGTIGEKIINYYSFYTVFSTPEEYRLITAKRTLGTLPVTYPIMEDSFLIFAGHRWQVTSVDLKTKTVFVVPSTGGKPPQFSGGIGNVADVISKEMLEILKEIDIPDFLNDTAGKFLREARINFINLGLAESVIIEYAGDSLLFPWRGDKIINTIRIMLQKRGLTVTQDGIAITVQHCKKDKLLNILDNIMLYFATMATITLSNISKTLSIGGAQLPGTFLSKLFRKPGTPKVSSFSITGLNLTIPDGKVMVILGPSGCGKSTILRIMAGLIKPDIGQVLYDNVDMYQTPPSARGIGMVFQNYALYPHLNARKNLLSFFMFKRRTPKLDATAQAKLQRTSQLLGVDIQYLFGKKPNMLSGGERQRVALGRCITREPKLFLLDEPFSNLDQQLREKYRLHLKILLRQFNITTIYVTHDQQEAALLADLITVMRAGNIEQIGTLEEIYEKPKNIFVAEFLNLDTEISAINLLSGDSISKTYSGLNIGVRPEEIAWGAGNTTVRGRIVDLHHNTIKKISLLNVKIGHSQLTARLALDKSLPCTGEAILNLNKFHLFDCTSGIRLRTIGCETNTGH